MFLELLGDALRHPLTVNHGHPLGVGQFVLHLLLFKDLKVIEPELGFPLFLGLFLLVAPFNQVLVNCLVPLQLRLLLPFFLLISELELLSIPEKLGLHPLLFLYLLLLLSFLLSFLVVDLLLNLAEVLILFLLFVLKLDRVEFLKAIDGLGDHDWGARASQRA